MQGLLCAIVLLFVACTTNPTTGEREPDWQFIASELSATQGDLKDLGPSFVDDAQGQAILESVSLVLADVELTIRKHTESGEPVDVYELMVGALHKLPDVVDVIVSNPAKQERLQREIGLARALLRHIAALHAQGKPVPST